MSRPAVVLIPGLMCDAGLWAEQSAALRGRAIPHEVADHGQASSLSAMAQAILGRHEGPLLAAGHSMGGRVALEIARLAGPRLRGLALLDTGYRPLAAGEAGERERRSRLALLDQARHEGVRSMALRWVQGMVHPMRDTDTALIGAIADMFARRSAEVFSAQIQALLQRPDASAVLAQVRCPTLLLCGEQDHWSPPAQHREMQQLIPGSELVLVPEAGHMAPMERPAAVTAALLSWLERAGW
jgi:pimeloyl-ACP methyl ester carboxylesterase